MKKKIYVSAALLGIGILTLSGCKSREKVDLTGIHTTAVETMSPTGEAAESGGSGAPAEKETEKRETAAASTEAKSTAAPPEKGKDSSSALSVRSKIATYKDGKVSIEYPILSNLRDSKTEEAVNKLLLQRATYVLDAYEIKPETDTVQIECSVISLSRSKAVLTYEGSVMNEGSAYPINVFYTSSIDLNKGTEIGLADYADAYTMAGYIVSDDCKLENSSVIDGDAEKEVMEYIKSQTVEQYWEQLKRCDFTSSTSKEEGAFPQTFSYENQGVIYMIIPTQHALGDYAVIRFAPDTK